MKTSHFFSAFALVSAVGCSSASHKTAAQPTPLPAKDGVETQLKVTSGAGRLKAKMTIKNATDHELVIRDLRLASFHVETVDNKAIPLKNGVAATKGPLHIQPGQSVETAFDLQNAYPFWERLTKYRISYEGSGLKSNTVQVWY